MLFGSPFPKEGDFFGLFNQMGQKALEAAKELKKLAKDPIGNSDSIDRIKEIEHAADNLTHAIMQLLHETFITPIEREHIHELSTVLDNVVDGFDAIAARIRYFEIKKMPEGSTELAELCFNGTVYMEQVMRSLSSIGNPEQLLPLCDSIHKIENEADDLVRTALSRIFRDPGDPRLLIQHKELYEWLEKITDRIEHVASCVQMIIVEST